MLWKYPATYMEDQGATGFWASDLVGSGTTRSGSTSSWVPRPLQDGQAPQGALNEN